MLWSKVPPQLSRGPPLGTQGCFIISPESSLPRLNLPNSVFIKELFQSSDYLPGLPQAQLQLRSPSPIESHRAGTARKVQCHETEIEDRISSPPRFPCCLGCSPGNIWVSGLQVHMAGSSPASHPPTPPSPIQGCSQWILYQARTYA